MAFVEFDEILDVGGHVSKLQVAAPTRLLGNILGDVTRPALGAVEAENLDRPVVLTGEQIGDDGFEVGSLVVGFAPDRPNRPRSSTTR
jgi:hypothetical protein